MSDFAEFMLRLPYSILGACIGRKFGYITMLVCGIVGAAVAELLISLL